MTAPDESRKDPFQIDSMHCTDSARSPPVNDAGAVSTSVTICCVLSCSVGEPVKGEMERYT